MTCKCDFFRNFLLIKLRLLHLGKKIFFVTCFMDCMSVWQMLIRNNNCLVCVGKYGNNNNVRSSIETVCNLDRRLSNGNVSSKTGKLLNYQTPKKRRITQRQKFRTQIRRNAECKLLSVRLTSGCFCVFVIKAKIKHFSSIFSILIPRISSRHTCHLA